MFKRIRFTEIFIIDDIFKIVAHNRYHHIVIVEIRNGKRVVSSVRSTSFIARRLHNHSPDWSR